MPSSLTRAVNFLETQWSSINANKLKGIAAELRFEEYLQSAAIRSLYQYIIPGGWILTPAKNTIVNPVSSGRIAIIPIPTPFSWSTTMPLIPVPAMVLAESYFRQTGIITYFTKFETNGDRNIERRFDAPRKRHYIASYRLNFYKIGANGLNVINIQEVMTNFTARDTLRGLRAYATGRVGAGTIIRRSSIITTNLFWKEYSRYYLQRYYRISAADLDFFIVGNSGRAYPIEFKSKTVVPSPDLGEWFGIDVNPFAKLAFFVSLSNNMEALYFVEEVDSNGNTLDWWGVGFSKLLKFCIWVPQGGGTSMGGGRSTTIIVPKSIFDRLINFLPLL